MGSYYHAGHTVQFTRTDVRAFYNHYGNSTLGYDGVPPSWNIRGLIAPAWGFFYHAASEYISYIEIVSKGPRWIQIYIGLISLKYVLTRTLVRKMMMKLRFMMHLHFNVWDLFYVFHFSVIVCRIHR